jgi:hypothetical protein
MPQNNKNILIIGMSKMGKTHFGGQLYGRLKTQTNAFVLRETPNDLSLFDKLLDRLNDGYEGEHTSSSLHQTIILPVKSSDGQQHVDIVYPDYGGEQIRNIVEQRSINERWQQQINNTNDWFLFIRLDLMENVTDISTKFYKQIAAEQDGKTENPNRIIDLPEFSSAFYVELLQIFLFVKKVGLASKTKPKLTVLLSCWDKLNKEEGCLPSDVLAEKMPMFSKFIHNIWSENQMQIVGLSSLGKDLNKDKADNEYAIKGPEEFGFIILPNGKQEEDISKILNNVL